MTLRDMSTMAAPTKHAFLRAALCLLCIQVLTVVCLDVNDVVFVGLTQRNSYHVRRAAAFKKHLKEQFKDIKGANPDVVLTHERWSSVQGAWTIFPIIPGLAETSGDKKWVFICEDETRVKVTKLVSALEKYDHSKELFLGKPLQDREASIIHHFAFFEDPSKFAYPDFAAGTLLSMPLVKRIANTLKDYDTLKEAKLSDFSIDAKHELALFIHNKGISLEKLPGLCTGRQTEDCITTYTVFMPECGEPVSVDDVYIGIKTCKKFYTDRVPVVKKTWAKETKHYDFYSEETNPEIPTISVGVQNTEHGHCGKTWGIFNRFVKEKTLKKFKWLLIADDDTIISIARLRKLLACYDAREPVVLGEVYGYGVTSGHGYNYITGGGGMVFSRPAVEELINAGHCGCHGDDSPDDMTIGMCYQSLGIPLTHSSLFHQARPDDYSLGYLSRQTPVSFHKHWMNDPIKVYKDLLSGMSKTAHDEF